MPIQGSTPGVASIAGGVALTPGSIVFANASGALAGDGATLNVKGDGAKGDGVTDDSAAINAAITAATANGGSVYLPPGTYIVGASVALPGNVALIGAGSGATTIKAKPSSNIAPVVATSASRVTIQGLTVDGNRANQSSTTAAAILLTLCPDAILRDVAAINACKIGVALAGCLRALLENVTGSASGLTGTTGSTDLWLGNSGATLCNGSRLVNTRALTAGTQINSDDVTVIGGYSTATYAGPNGDSCYYVGNNLRRVRFIGCTAENGNNYGYDFDFSNTDDTYECAVIGCTARGNRNAGVGGASNGLVISGGSFTDNGNAGLAGGASVYPYGILVDALNVVASGNKCTDTRAGGSKTQTYGLFERNLSTVTANGTYVGNDWQGNATAGYGILSTTGREIWANNGSNQSSSSTDFIVGGAFRTFGQVGVFGAGAVSQQTGGAATAGATYTATEQGMLNRIYAGLRAYGWLS